MARITTIGVDLAKNVLQVHGVDAQGKVVAARQLWRRQVLALVESRSRAWSAWKRAAARTIGRVR